MQSPQSVASEVWARFVGLFGGKAVTTKFGDEPPAEWVSVISRLNQYQLERGMRRLLASGRAGVPSLPEFSRLCRALQDEDLDASDDRPALPAPDTWRGDKWDAAANNHLLAHVVKQLAKDPRRYGGGCSFRLMSAPEQDVRKLGLDMKILDASGQFIANTRKLVEAKNLWAADMRDIQDKAGEVDAELQRKIWDDYLGRAEAQVCSGNPIT